MKTEKETWDHTKELLEDYKANFGDHWSYNFRNDPKRLGFVLSRYKFAAKMACRNARVLELGCSEGIGGPILGEMAVNYTGVDLDESAIQTAKGNLKSPKFNFIHDDFMGKTYGAFDAIVSLDVIEHIHKEYEDQYFQTIMGNLSKSGICVIGTPNISSAPYASKGSQLGHVNLYSQERLSQEMKKYFNQVFSFGMNDEIVHTGFGPMCHYLICLACDRRK
jgi:cyclopropane fatty-acyl-phospholipid synthase-like methyltransferase